MKLTEIKQEGACFFFFLEPYSLTVTEHIASWQSINVFFRVLAPASQRIKKGDLNLRDNSFTPGTAHLFSYSESINILLHIFELQYNKNNNVFPTLT